jgi:hypothetical protein
MRLSIQTTAMILVDVQEKLFYHIDRHELIEGRLKTLIQGLQCLEIPILCNQQYTKGLGETIPSIKCLLKDATVHEKVRFSCCSSEGVVEVLKKQGVKNVVLAGVEAHVCVLQTALDLKDADFEVLVCADATGSRVALDYEAALHRMRQEGVFIGSVESLLFELLKSASHPQFKAISQLVKER